PSGWIHGLLRVEVGGRRHHQGARLRMGRHRYHRERAGADRVSLAAHPMDVRGQRTLARGTQGVPHSCPERASRRAIRSRRSIIVPRIQGIGLLHWAYPLCRRWLHRGMTIAKARIATIAPALMAPRTAQVVTLTSHT